MCTQHHLPPSRSLLLWCRAYLLAREHMGAIHSLVAGMADSGLPCFLFPDTLQKVRACVGLPQRSAPPLAGALAIALTPLAPACFVPSLLAVLAALPAGRQRDPGVQAHAQRDARCGNQHAHGAVRRHPEAAEQHPLGGVAVDTRVSAAVLSQPTTMCTCFSTVGMKFAAAEFVMILNK